MRCTYSGTGCNPQQEEKYTMQNTLHDCNDVQSFWRDEELSVNKLSCRLTQLTTNLCLDVSRGVRSSQRCNKGSIFEGKPPLSCFIYSSRTAVLLKSSALKERAESRTDRWCEDVSCLLFRPLSEKLLLLPLLFFKRESAIKWCHTNRNGRIEWRNSEQNNYRETTRHDRLSEWVKDTTPQLLYDYRCASILSSHHRNSLLNSSAISLSFS